MFAVEDIRVYAPNGIPVETKYHPSAVDSLRIIQRLIGQTKNQNLMEFLEHEFVNIPKAQAERLIGKMGPDVTSETQVNSLTLPQIACMHQLFQHTKFDDPNGNIWLQHILQKGKNPFHPYLIYTHNQLGIYKWLHFRAQVYQGHPFIVEAGVSLGGEYFKQVSGVSLFKWKIYKINKMQQKIGVFVNIVSTKNPFKATGMDYIGDDISEIVEAVKANNNNNIVLYVNLELSSRLLQLAQDPNN
uniref:DNA topoisomerase VI subunit B transducer domain-containing protein n=1 Tax=Lactuca sativa TaxID=4236 RepID=A0A9R1WNA5_LACSA|nr:hypothetical protein LSAT_V11C100048350 [Lactuca sativa]